MNKMKPLFKHDCTECKFLGTFNGQDLYFCNQVEAGSTVIARYGDEGSEYFSGMVFAKPDVSEELFEAKNRAIKLGYLK